MRNKKIGRKAVIISLAFLLLIGYLHRIWVINRDNEKTEIHYLSDDSPVVAPGILYGEEMAAEDQKQMDGLEITVTEEKIYETAAFIDTYPAISGYYRHGDSGMPGLAELSAEQEERKAVQYVLYLQLQVRNTTEYTLDIPYYDYKLYAGRSYQNGQNPFMVEELNQASGIAVQAGHSYTVHLAFELNEHSFQSGKYNDLIAQKFSLMVSGYPEIRHIELNHAEMVEADQKAIQIYESLIGTDQSDIQQLSDTKIGTMLEKGEDCVMSGVRIRVESYEIQDNLFDCQDYGVPANGEEGDEVKTASNGNGELIERFAGKPGTSKSYYVFVTFRIQNDLPYPCQVPLSNINIYNYAGKEGSCLCSYYIPKNSNIVHTVNSAVYTIPAYGNELFTYGTAVTDFEATLSKPNAKRGWYLDQGRKIYVSFICMAPQGVDLTKKDPGDGIFLPIN